jgi:hypothetical protein
MSRVYHGSGVTIPYNQRDFGFNGLFNSLSCYWGSEKDVNNRTLAIA